ncbi:putative intracellular protease/amidase [Paraburkholderia sp. GAS199]|uniref:type 1 glutamine amidotransferase domain-containing protein n=1 Tax=Paraburkholderia sp. GAS199 TaxID=3035126 RepID=UPI003D1CF855
MPLPSLDFDPTEVAISWSILTAASHEVSFATPDGRPAEADTIMVSGRGLDPWSPLPGLGKITLIGHFLGANSEARQAYASMTATARYQQPERWSELRADRYDALLLGGGHRARGMRQYLESETLQQLVAGFFEAGKPVAAICHGVLLAARSKAPDGNSVLYGRKTTALTWKLEKAASGIARFSRFWDRDYYRTYTEKAGEPEGYMSVEHEVGRHLASPRDFLDVPRNNPHFRKKTSGLSRDTLNDDSPAWVVVDGNYVSGRWPGDAHTFARTFAELLAGNSSVSSD